MGVDEYNFGSIISRVRAEFGEVDNPDTNEQIGNKINGALLWICKRRKWPFMRKDLIIDVGDQQTVYATIERGKTALSLVAPLPTVSPEVRDFFVVGENNAVDGYLISAVAAANSLTLQSQFRGTSITNQIGSIQKGIFAMPDDFAKAEGKLKQSDPLGIGDMTYVAPNTFRDVSRSFRAFAIRDRIYTVQSDPLGLSGKAYLCVYPYVNSMLSFYGSYWRVPQQLVNNADIPVIPPEHRDVLFYFACWFWAQSKGVVETMQFYQQQALETLQLMAKDTDMVDEEDNVSISTSDPSGFIPGPSNYPDFNLQ